MIKGPEYEISTAKKPATVAEIDQSCLSILKISFTAHTPYVICDLPCNPKSFFTLFWGDKTSYSQIKLIKN